VSWNSQRTVCRCDLCLASTTTDGSGSSGGRRRLGDSTTDVIIQESGFIEVNAMATYVFGDFVKSQQKFQDLDDPDTYIGALIVILFFGSIYIITAISLMIALYMDKYEKKTDEIQEKMKLKNSNLNKINPDGGVGNGTNNQQAISTPTMASNNKVTPHKSTTTPITPTTSSIPVSHDVTVNVTAHNDDGISNDVALIESGKNTKVSNALGDYLQEVFPSVYKEKQDSNTN
jgi:hypothetical protein